VTYAAVQEPGDDLFCACCLSAARALPYACNWHRKLRGRDGATLEQRIGDADVLVVSGFWRNDLLPRAKRLRFIQSIGAGTDQFSREALRQHGVRLASARGVNALAVSEHEEFGLKVAEHAREHDVVFKVGS